MDRREKTTQIFFTSTCRAEHKKYFPNEKVSFAEFAQRCSERWKSMGPAEKQRFQAMADQDKKRHEDEMAFYVPAKGREKLRQRDPNAPKRPLCGFFWFCRYERNRVKLMYPNCRQADIAKILARLWVEANPDAKRKYDDMGTQDKARYEMEMTAYKKAQQQPVHMQNHQKR